MESERHRFPLTVVVVIIECVVHLALCIQVGLRIWQRGITLSWGHEARPTRL